MKLEKLTLEEILKAREVYDELSILCERYFNDHFENQLEWTFYRGWTFSSLKSDVIVISFIYQDLSYGEPTIESDSLSVEISELLSTKISNL